MHKQLRNQASHKWPRHGYQHQTQQVDDMADTVWRPVTQLLRNTPANNIARLALAAAKAADQRNSLVKSIHVSRAVSANRAGDHGAA